MGRGRKKEPIDNKTIDLLNFLRKYKNMLSISGLERDYLNIEVRRLSTLINAPTTVDESHMLLIYKTLFTFHRDLGRLLDAIEPDEYNRDPRQMRIPD